jgi:hypothetical protein
MNNWKKIWSNNIVQFILFSGLIWLIFVHLHLNRHFQDIIVGPHYWRKSDTYAQILNYYYNNLNFFDHGLVFNQFDSNGKAVAEFPLFYYFIAIQFKLFGPSLILAKINWIALLFIGQFFLFKIARFFIKNAALSLLVPLSLFLSPVFTFYSVDFMPDPLALNISLVGYWFLIKHYNSEKNKYLWVSILCISLAGMIKPFFLIPFIAFVIVLGFNKWVIHAKTIDFKKELIIPFIMVLLWFLYTKLYNQSVNSNYFLSEPKPFWLYNSDQLNQIIERVNKRWLPEYLNPSLYIYLFLMMLINLVVWTKKNRLITLFYSIALIGITCYILLFFGMFHDHDYYIFPMVFFIPLSLGVFFLKLTEFIKNKWILNGIALGLMFLFYQLLNYTYQRIELIYKEPWINSKHKYENYIGLEHFLQKNNITLKDYVIAYSDISPTYALMLLNRKGWSNKQFDVKKGHLQKYINKGASVLVINKREPLTIEDSLILRPYLNHYLDDTNDVYLYDLKPFKP